MIEELENVESKAEEFPLTLSFLDYLHKIPHCFDQNNSGFVIYWYLQNASKFIKSDQVTYR